MTLSLAEMIKEKRGEDPILVLDDVMSDLDTEKQKKLLDTIQGFQQVLLSGSSLDEDAEKVNVIEIKSDVVDEEKGGQ